MNTLFFNAGAIYGGIVLLLFATASLWMGLTAENGGNIKHRLKSCVPTMVQLTVCSLGYGVFFFVLMLAIGIAAWLVLLGLVYLPVDILNNALGDQLTEKVVASITPYVNRSSYSPGLFHQPILDYATLSTLFFAPVAGVWSIAKSNKRSVKDSRSLGDPAH